MLFATTCGYCRIALIAAFLTGTELSSSFASTCERNLVHTSNAEYPQIRSIWTIGIANKQLTIIELITMLPVVRKNQGHCVKSHNDNTWFFIIFFIVHYPEYNVSDHLLKSNTIRKILYRSISSVKRRSVSTPSTQRI